MRWSKHGHGLCLRGIGQHKVSSQPYKLDEATQPPAEESSTQVPEPLIPTSVCTTANDRATNDAERGQHFGATRPLRDGNRTPTPRRPLGRPPGVPREGPSRATHTGDTTTAEADNPRPDASLWADRQPFGNAAPRHMAIASKPLLCEEPGAPPGGPRATPRRDEEPGAPPGVPRAGNDEIVWVCGCLHACFMFRPTGAHGGDEGYTPMKQHRTLGICNGKQTHPSPPTKEPKGTDTSPPKLCISWSAVNEDRTPKAAKPSQSGV